MRTNSRSIAEWIVRNADEAPSQTAIVFYGEDGSRLTLTNAEILAEVRRHAGALRSAGARKGDLVVLALRHQIELVYAFWAVVYAGAVPSIFPYPPLVVDQTGYLRRVAKFAGNCRARFVVTTGVLADDLRTLLGGEAAAIPVDSMRNAPIDDELRPEPMRGDEIAILQHTSGTTGAQKGIAHSHEQCLQSIENITQWLPPVSDDVIVGWVPLYHDLGLVTELFMPTYETLPVVMISPLAWISKPAILFRAIHEHRGTCTWLPNFALNHCVRSIDAEDLRGLDLSHVRVLRATAEPARADSLRTFAEKFAPFGFSETAFSNVYGMTEILGGCACTPVVGPPAIDRVDRALLQTERRAVPAEGASRDVTSIVSCGAPVPGVEMQIVDDDDRPLPERTVGHVRARSAWMMTEYLGAPEKTAESIRDGWLRTGDLGYFAEGELYVCGREKDLIITRGHNIHPEDLEEIANGIDGLAPGRSVAFGVMNEDEGTEDVVMVCELRPNTEPALVRSIEQAIRLRVVQSLDVALADVRLVSERNWVIKTTSGKIARSANREKYLRTLR